MKQHLIKTGNQALIAFAFIGVAVMLRGDLFAHIYWYHPDEAELMAQGVAAMRSPVPFTTWTTATTGPYWVLFLALLGAFGAPMTLAFAHFLAAVLVGFMGYAGFALARRDLPVATSLLLTVFWWMPIVLLLTGHIDAFGALNTELLPCALILGAWFIRLGDKAPRAGLLLATGVLCGLSVGAKYQVLPLALAILGTQLIRAGEGKWRPVLRHVAIFGAGGALPFAIVALAMLVTPGVSMVALEQNFNFLTQYSGETSLGLRAVNTWDIVAKWHVFLLLLLVLWLAILSPMRIALCRALLVLGGLASVFLGNQAADHYVYFLYAAIVMAFALPLSPGRQVVPYFSRPWQRTGAVALVLLIGWLVAFGTSSLDTVSRTKRSQLATALSADPVDREPRLLEVCPAGSDVIVWGWAPELYLDYSWRNAIPFMNAYQLTQMPDNYSSGYDLMRKAISDPATDCVIDAVGKPFFWTPPKLSVTRHYPELAGLLDRDYVRATGVITCEACAVYIRRGAGA